MAQEKNTQNIHAVLSGDTQDNPLVTAANPLLNSIPLIRHSTTHPDPTDLRQKLIDEIRNFELKCQHAKLPYEVIIGARYCLCTTLDESAALTPWGTRSVWSTSGLLVTFHNETWGGEKFFQLLATLSQKPKENLLLLELINFCLQLGFEGRYRIMDNGHSQLETLKQRLFQLIHSVRGSYPPELSPTLQKSPALQKAAIPNKRRQSPFPLWVYIIGIIVLACILYIGLNWTLGYIAKPSLTKIDNIAGIIEKTNLPNVSVENRIASPVLPVLPSPHLKNMLSNEIAEGLLTVSDSSNKSVITLQGDGLFNTGSSRIRNRYVSVIKRIAEAMKHTKGEILVIGHTDNVPINNTYYLSNDQLSFVRAESVKKELQKYLDKSRYISIEGKGDNNPLLPNDTPSHRAKNRRVEIILLVSPVNQTE